MNCVLCADAASLIGPVWNWITSQDIGGALIGAFAGAFAATRFAEHRETNLILMQRLDSLNRGLSLSAGCAVSAILYKDQILKESIDQYFRDKKRFELFLNASVPRLT